ncbi:metal-sensing transcriptional repressor [Dongia sp.]|uniref:metal-sensing transcriptional repressor n=1 Tax=Dongia sp. TaxID=1977262 RepID=UPI003752DAF0
MTDEDLHGSHPDIVKRLKRGQGHLRSVVEMIEAGRPCLEIAQQLYAVEKAISKAKRVLIQDHIDHCLEHAVNGSRRAPLGEFKEISKYL